jgi:pimeloyl-ACP methyl ester carboxylesterase
MTVKSEAAVAAWEQRGHRVPTEMGDIFCVDIDGPSDRPPALVIHGYPSSSYDWSGVVETLSADRRVVLFDLLGFGLSAKPDRPYGIRVQADVAEAVATAHGLDRAVLITHDLGDTVGGEIQARSIDGTLPFDIAGRLVTNGSIYIDMAHLTNGQQLLLSLPDEKLAPGLITAESFRSALAHTMADDHQPSEDELDAQWELSSRDDGHLLLARLIRYIEERRREERRFTGAIETHPSPLGVLWGVKDPIAIIAMVDTLVAARPDAVASRLADLAHYPMIEDPVAFGAEAVRLLRLVDGG